MRCADLFHKSNGHTSPPPCAMHSWVVKFSFLGSFLKCVVYYSLLALESPGIHRYSEKQVVLKTQSSIGVVRLMGSRYIVHRRVLPAVNRLKNTIHGVLCDERFLLILFSREIGTTSIEKKSRGSKSVVWYSQDPPKLFGP